MADERPIGLFDSGIGGLTVLKTLLDEFPNENFIYLGDTARLPYGSKSPNTIQRYLKQNVDFLLAQNVKAVIVACNSASTVLLNANELSFPVKVYNVIEPGAETALAKSVSKKIGVLGTKATVGAKAYVRAIHARDPEAVVYQQACPLLVPLVEEGWEEDPITNLVVFRYVNPILQAGIDTLIMGCTHYPALRTAFEKVAGSGVQLVDSSKAIAKALRHDLDSKQLPEGGGRTVPVKFLATDVSDSFVTVGRRLIAPHEFTDPQVVDL